MTPEERREYKRKWYAEHRAECIAASSRGHQRLKRERAAISGGWIWTKKPDDQLSPEELKVREYRREYRRKHPEMFENVPVSSARLDIMLADYIARLDEEFAEGEM